MKKVLNEWFIDAPWGKIALVSWGSPIGEPVLLVHGRQDSVATFIPLLDLLPDTYHYVGLDLPGHGKSDPFPIGLMLSRIQFITPVDLVVKHLGWKSFAYICHSMGGEIGLMYNAIRPNMIKKFVFLDVGMPLNNIVHKPFPDWFKSVEKYYQNYETMNHDDRVYTKSEAVKRVMNARGLSRELAEMVLSRNLRKQPGAIDKYKLSWDKRLKILIHSNLKFEHYVYLFTTNIPPTLFISASSTVQEYENQHGGKLIEEMKKKVVNFVYKIVDGSHDVHLINPKSMAGDVTAFLKNECLFSKL